MSKNTHDILVFILALVFVTGMYSISYQYRHFNVYVQEHLPANIEMAKEAAENRKVTAQRLTLFGLLQTRDERNYNRETNNCYDQSQELQQWLAKFGIQSSIFINKDRNHAWLAVWVEATDGTFNIRGTHDILEVRDENLNVICSATGVK
jgi:hypothetical protein